MRQKKLIQELKAAIIIIIISSTIELLEPGEVLFEDVEEESGSALPTVHTGTQTEGNESLRRSRCEDAPRLHYQSDLT